MALRRWSTHARFLPAGFFPRKSTPNSWNSSCSNRISKAFSTDNGENKLCMVYGGAGGLGSGIVDTFSQAGWQTASVDLIGNQAADHSLLIPSGDAWGVASKKISDQLTEMKIVPDVIVNAAGGWGGGSVCDEKIFETVDVMLSQNLLSAFASGYLASNHLAKNGLLVLVGAAAVASGGSSSGMAGYAAAKAGVHNLVSTLAEEEGLGAKATVIGIMPNVIDTPGNRQAMPNADHDKWTKPSVFAKAILHWASDGSATEKFPKLENGQFYTFETLKSGKSIADYINGVETAYLYKSE